MKAKSMLAKSPSCLLLLMTIASFGPTAHTTNSDANDADANDAITVTAYLLRDSYALGQAVPLEIVVTNHGQEPVYTYVDESGYLDLAVIVEDVNGNRIEHGPVWEPPPPPPHYYIKKDGKKVLTLPVVEVKPGQTTELTIRDALNLYHGYLQEGVYYLILRELPVIHEVGFVISREDQEHKLWVDPYTVISRARYEINNVEITLHQGKIIYVDDDAVGANNGTSWENAYTFLQDALYDADVSEKPVEMHVAQGIYRPDQGWRSDGRPEFRLRKDWTLLGCYAGVGQADSNDRDLEKYKTVLSGDVNGDDAIPDNIEELVEEPTRTDNIHDVVHTSFTDESLLLDGFIITGAISHGMVTYDSSCRISNCVFMRNSSDGYGGALRTEGHNSIGPMITCCRFINNVSSKAGGAVLNSCFTTFVTCDFIGNIAEDGGALSNYEDVELIDCTFESNVAETGGALEHSSFATMMLDGCIFRGNRVQHNSDSPQSVVRGGAVYIKGSDTMITNCVFRANSTGSTGGAIAAYDASVTISRCVFTGNRADQQGGAVYGRFADLQFNACEFSGNSADTDGAAIYAVKTIPDFKFGLHLNTCTLADNIALNGRAIACKFYSGSGIRNGSGTAVQAIFSDYNVSKDLSYVHICNSIINNGDNEIFNPDGLQIIIDYTDFLGGVSSIVDPCNSVVWGTGNINADPCFADPGYWAGADDPDIAVEPNNPNAVWIDGDYHLKSQAGRWDPASESWIVDDVTSPCIDAGDPNIAVGDEPMPNGGIINIGAYGGTPQASLSPLIGQASNPNPPDGAFGVSPEVILSWSPGEDAVAHDVYFGFTPSPGFVCNQIETDFNPGQLYSQGMLPSQADCYWRIDEIDSHGNIIPGETWRFKVQEYKGRLCFTGQTPVWINDSFTPISKVAIGQSIDGINRIEQVQEHEGTFTLYDILLESGNCITVAENHIFMTDANNWLSLHKLKAGTRLKTLNGSIGIQSVTKQPSPFTGKVYNLKIQGSDRYIVGKDMVIVRDY